MCLFVLGLTALLNILVHFATVPACSTGTLTNVLQRGNAMSQTQDITTHPVTVYRHRVNQSLCYPLMWNMHSYPFYCLGSDPTGRSFADLQHTHANAQLYDTDMVVVCRKLRSKVPYQPSLEPGTCGVRIHITIRSPTVASCVMCGYLCLITLHLKTSYTYNSSFY